MKIFTRSGLLKRDTEKRTEFIRWAMEQAGYPLPVRDFAIEQHVVYALAKASNDPLSDITAPQGVSS